MWRERLCDYSSGLSVIRQGSSCRNKYPSFTFFQPSDVLFRCSLIQLLTCKNTLFMNDVFHLNHHPFFSPCDVSWYGIGIHAISVICLFRHVLSFAYTVHRWRPRTMCMVIGKSPFTIPTIWFGWINQGCSFLSLCHFHRSLIFSLGVCGSECRHSHSGRFRIRLEHLFFYKAFTYFRYTIRENH